NESRPGPDRSARGMPASLVAFFASPCNRFLSSSCLAGDKSLRVVEPLFMYLLSFANGCDRAGKLLRIRFGQLADFFDQRPFDLPGQLGNGRRLEYRP